jgi:hypothetical protein
MPGKSQRERERESSREREGEREREREREERERERETLSFARSLAPSLSCSIAVPLPPPGKTVESLIASLKRGRAALSRKLLSTWRTPADMKEAVCFECGTRNCEHLGTVIYGEINSWEW